MRKISPFISLILIVLVLSGSQGFTFVRHSCSSCGTNEIYAAGAEDESSCCIHSSENPAHRQGTDHFIFSDDCCTHETERLITAELIRTEVQPEVMPYLLAAMIIAVVPAQPEKVSRTYSDDSKRRNGRDLTTLHCQIIS